MNKVKQAFLYVWRLWYVKYVIVCIVGLLVVGILDENSVWAHLNYKHRISQLEDEIAHYEAINDRNQSQINQLKHNPKAIEKIARERYFMKTDDEDIFVLSDDEQQPAPQATSHETAE